MQVSSANWGFITICRSPDASSNASKKAEVDNGGQGIPASGLLKQNV
jgi:hypothetical protein